MRRRKKQFDILKVKVFPWTKPLIFFGEFKSPFTTDLNSYSGFILLHCKIFVLIIVINEKSLSYNKLTLYTN